MRNELKIAGFAGALQQESGDDGAKRGSTVAAKRKTMRGYRTLLLALAYLVWVLVLALIVRPAGGYTGDVLSGLATLAGTTGITVVGLAGARAAKSYALAKHGAFEDPA